MVKVHFITAEKSDVDCLVNGFLENIQQSGDVKIVDIKHSSVVEAGSRYFQSAITVCVIYETKTI